MHELVRGQYCRFRHCHRFFLNEFRRRTRSFSGSSTNRSCVNDPDSSCVLVEENARSRTVILNRPSLLNALNAPMMKKLQKLYESWEHNPNVGFVVMKGNGNAFSSGGDLVTMLANIKKGNIEGTKEIFSRAYKLVHLVHTYLKPNVAILNGIAMGGGAGISVLGTFRIVTDKTVFATPETLVGLHTDGGASFYLSRLPGHLGEYLGLTADRLNGAEMMACGLATHYTHNTNVQFLEQHLRNLVTDDPYVLETSLQNYTDHFDYPDDNSVLKRMELVNRCFSQNTVEEIIDSLESEAARTRDGWCFSVLKKLKYASPLSLKVTLRSIREGRFQTLDQCLIREYRMTLQGISGQISSDFSEGVRAKMIDKDFKPKWDPPSLKHVSQDMVDRYFSPLSSREPELDLPTKEEEAVAQN